MQKMVEEGVDGAKTRAGMVDVMVVGGGACLVGEELEGVARSWRPQYGHVANAIGAAIPQVRSTFYIIMMSSSAVVVVVRDANSFVTRRREG